MPSLHRYPAIRGRYVLSIWFHMYIMGFSENMVPKKNDKNWWLIVSYLPLKLLACGASPQFLDRPVDGQHPAPVGRWFIPTQSDYLQCFMPIVTNWCRILFIYGMCLYVSIRNNDGHVRLRQWQTADGDLKYLEISFFNRNKPQNSGRNQTPPEAAPDHLVIGELVLELVILA